MFMTEVKRVFTTNVSIARALGITKVSVGNWDDLIPELRARQLAEITRGKLKFRPELYRQKRSA